MQNSAGLLMYHFVNTTLEIYLVHPGGPFNNESSRWQIPKGLQEEHETDLLLVAQREFEEETGNSDFHEFFSLGSTVVNGNRKTIHIWAFEGELTKLFSSNNFTAEWPPRSGKFEEFPENDKGAFMTIEKAKELIVPAEIIFIERLENILNERK